LSYTRKFHELLFYRKMTWNARVLRFFLDFFGIFF